MLRLKHVAHVLVKTQGHNSEKTPLQALIELSHKVISENDSSVIGSSRNDLKTPGSNFARDMGLPSYGDYDSVMGALKQLQKRTTVNLIYDPKKQF